MSLLFLMIEGRFFTFFCFRETNFIVEEIQNHNYFDIFAV